MASPALIVFVLQIGQSPPPRLWLALPERLFFFPLALAEGTRPRILISVVRGTMDEHRMCDND